MNQSSNEGESNSQINVPLGRINSSQVNSVNENSNSISSNIVTSIPVNTNVQPIINSIAPNTFIVCEGSSEIGYTFDRSSTTKDVLDFFGVKKGHLQTEKGKEKPIYNHLNYLPTSGKFILIRQSPISFWSKFFIFRIAVVITSIHFIIQIIYYSIKINS